MLFHRKLICAVMSVVLLLSGCASGNNTENETDKQGTQGAGISSVSTALDTIDMTKWQYNADADVYWQTGIVYCENPADESYENLGIYVPGAYMIGEENEDGTYSCEINAEGAIGEYTAENAPIVIPVETPGYSAMAAPTGYVSSTKDYTDAGFVYVYAGCRGRESGAPAGVTDLKAAIRYIRYNNGVIPGSTERIFTFGMSGGGAQSALLGATGDSELYTPYLEQIGAVSGVSDSVAGSMCWCPITNLDYASEAYEWNLGVTRSGLDSDMQQLSDDMAEAFALYINELGLTDENGAALVLSESDEGIYQSGSYYEYLKSVIEASLNNFLQDTEFPYTVGSDSLGGRENELPDGMEGDFGGRGNELPDGMEGDFGGRGNELPDGMEGDFKGGNGQPDDIAAENRISDGKQDFDEMVPDSDDTDADDDYYAIDGIDRQEVSNGIDLSGTYNTVQEYIDALNAETTWVVYDSETNTAEITGIADFVTVFKNASKDVGAFDDLNRTQGENILFGYGDGEGAHFDSVMAELLAGTEYVDAYADDLEKTDALGNTVEYRVNMYNPLYYLLDYYDGYHTSNVASYWRIRTGINQSDTALTTEVNLALALESYGAYVDFETVWGQAHVEAERTGNSTSNFIEWVNECLH